MGRNKKLQKFAELHELPNVYLNFGVNSPIIELPNGQKQDMRGQWKAQLGSDKPLVLELACGKGEYSLGLGQMYPHANFMGLDLKGNRIWTGAKKALEQGLDNVFFLRAQIDFIESFFAPEEVDEIWITFADPQAKKPRKRLTSALFLARYRNILKKGSKIHLKTDSPLLYEFTLEQIEEQGLPLEFAHDDIYSLAEQDPNWGITTYYEQLHRGKGATIKYARFRLD